MSIEIILSLAAIVVLLVLSAFFNGSETALTAASRARMHALEQEGNARAALVTRLLKNPERLIGQFSITSGVSRWRRAEAEHASSGSSSSSPPSSRLASGFALFRSLRRSNENVSAAAACIPGKTC